MKQRQLKVAAILSLMAVLLVGLAMTAMWLLFQFDSSTTTVGEDLTKPKMYPVQQIGQGQNVDPSRK